MEPLTNCDTGPDKDKGTSCETCDLDLYTDCTNCNAELDKDEGTACEICDSDLCKDCSEEGDCLNFTEWLVELPNQCSRCKKIGCRNCILTCHSCWAGEKKAEMICEKCNSKENLYEPCEGCLQSVNCKIHRAGKNDCGECAQCNANKNYCGRHSGW